MYMNICFNTMYVHSYKCIIVFILSKSESVQEMNFHAKDIERCEFKKCIEIRRDILRVEGSQ